MRVEFCQRGVHVCAPLNDEDQACIVPEGSSPRWWGWPSLDRQTLARKDLQNQQDIQIPTLCSVEIQGQVFTLKMSPMNSRHLQTEGNRGKMVSLEAAHQLRESCSCVWDPLEGSIFLMFLSQFKHFWSRKIAVRITLSYRKVLMVSTYELFTLFQSKQLSLIHLFNLKGQAWWYLPLISAPEKQKQTDDADRSLWVQARPSLCMKFQIIQRYIMRNCIFFKKNSISKAYSWWSPFCTGGNREAENDPKVTPDPAQLLIESASGHCLVVWQSSNLHSASGQENFPRLYSLWLLSGANNMFRRENCESLGTNVKQFGPPAKEGATLTDEVCLTSVSSTCEHRTDGWYMWCLPGSPPGKMRCLWSQVSGLVLCTPTSLLQIWVVFGSSQLCLISRILMSREAL